MSKTVLIVDDSIPVHKLVKTHLEPDLLILHSSYDGESALAAAVSLHPNLILLDVDMPLLDGFEVCRRLKLNPATAAIPLIFLTADSVLTDKVKGLDLGASDYITKPFKPEELRARVRSALRVKHLSDSTSMVDGMTGLWNRTYLDVQLTSQLSLSKRSGRPLACIVADVDRLQAINLKHGESIGNDILRRIGRILLSQCRSEDVVCRMAGGKFALLLSGTNRAGAARIADRIRCEVERQLQARGGIEMNITCSFGTSDTLIAGDDTLVDLADAAAYRAKQTGRNCVSVARQSGEDVYAA